MLSAVTFCGFLAILNVNAKLLEVRTITGEISRDALPGTQVLFDAPLRAHKQNPSQISIAIVNDRAADAFGVFPTVLSPGDSFAVVLRDSEVIPVMDANNTFYVPIEAKYLSEDRSETENISIQIDLLPGNPEVPRLLRSEQNFKLSQRLTDGIIGKIGIKNLAKTDLDKFKYEIFGGFSELFTIETGKDGLFLRTSGCDPETCLELPPEFTLLLRVTPITPPNTVNAPPTEIALLHLQIARENVVGPRFLQHEYVASVNEGATHFQESVQLEAIDPDGIGRMDIVLRESSDVFALDAVSGVLSVKNQSLLTIENLGTTVKLIAEVGDGKNVADVAEVTVRIMEANMASEEFDNIENWEFEQPIYAFAVAPRQKTVGRVSLINEAKGNMQIVEGGAGNFVLDSDSGIITYSGPIERVAKNYTLKLLATPRPRSNTVALAIAQILVAGIGSHAPVFDNSYLSTIVDYDTAIDSKVAQLSARDFDKNAALVFAEESADCLNCLANPIDCGAIFGVHPTGDIVVTKIIPDFLMSVRLNISVTDKTHRLEDKDYATVIITIRKEKVQPNVNAMFEIEELSEPLVLSDDLPVDTYIYTAVVKPLNNENTEILKPKPTFSLVNSPQFKIDEKTGMIYITKSLKDLGEANITVHVEIETTQGIKKINSTIPIEAVSMDVAPPEAGNVNPDGHLALFVDENAPPGTEIGQIHVKPSPEGGDLIYQLSGQSGIENMIEMSEDGKILVKGQIDYETTPKLNFFVKISNQLVKSSVVAVSVSVINLNDNANVFNESTNYNELSVLENAPIGTYIANLKASDADGNNLVYFLDIPTNSNLTDRISIDKYGQLLTASSLTGLEGSYNFSVLTKDGEHSTQKDVQLSVLPTMKCQPIFKRDQDVLFYISSDSMPGKPVAILKADSEDAAECEPIVYGLKFLGTGNQFNGSFKLNNATGVITLHSSLHHIARERLPIVISASSGHLFTQKAAEIFVVPESVPEPPVFGIKHVRFEIDENNAIGTVVGSVKAVSPEGLPVYYRLVDKTNLFTVNENGDIIAQKMLDREAASIHRLKLVASTVKNFDEKSTVSTPIIVSVNDLNDNIPRFKTEHTDVVLLATTVPGHIVTTVTAVDSDATINSTVYRVHSSMFKQDGKTTKIDGMVEVDSTGRVRLLRNVKELTGGKLEIVIEAVDSQNEIEQIAHTKVSVWIVDLDRHIIPILIHRNPVTLGAEQIRQYISKLQSNIPYSQILLQSLQFYSLPTEASIAPIVVRDATLAKFVAVDRLNNTIIPWKIVREAIKDLDIDGLSLVSGAPKPPAPAADLMSAESSVVLLAIVFAGLLSLILIVLGIILCYYRNKFRAERKQLVDAKIVADSVNRTPIRHYSPYLERPPELLWERSTTATTGSTTPERRSSYSVQEMKLAVFS